MGIRYHNADEDDIIEARSLFNRVFSASAPAECWRRKYFGNPAGPVVAFAAHDGTRLVGFYPLHPARFVVSGADTLLYQSADTMTDPAYRRQGVYGTLREKAHEWLLKEGVPFTYGFPNAVSLAANKGDWFELVGKMKRWVKPVTAERSLLGLAVNSVLYGFRSMLKRAPRRETEPLDVFDERIDAVWARVGARRPITGLRTAKFLEWRFGHLRDRIAAWVSDPEAPDGYVVAQKAGKGVWIRDLLVRDDNKASIFSLLSVVDEFATKAGSAHVVFPYIGTGYRRYLLAAGFVPVPGGATMIIVRRSDKDPSWARARNWFITDADRDIECV